jgi:hypothetical protein
MRVCVCVCMCVNVCVHVCVCVCMCVVLHECMRTCVRVQLRARRMHEGANMYMLRTPARKSMLACMQQSGGVDAGMSAVLTKRLGGATRKRWHPSSAWDAAAP